ncbi:MAG: pyridoxal phosphate-dependent aminotransferase [Deltaproteobacteria bacterium]|nr:pyridoxal phosphate-dependent aminotransferase [Deltaproteobacteria bacterium]
MAIAQKIKQFMEQSSWIRKMFEQGALMKAQYGPENVFDFSLGNPNLAPPPAFHQTLRNLLDESAPGLHAYMPNAGYLQTRQAVADFLSGEHGLPFTEKEVIMTCGAAGAINTVFRALLSPGDEIIILSPYFVEYLFYADNFQAVPKIVSSTSDFLPDPGAIEKALTPKTKAILINSPNNPTGRVYPAAAIEGLGELLRKWKQSSGEDVYLISDEPYRKIVYDSIQVPSIFQAYAESIVVTSYSKDLSIPGERIGYLAVNPQAPDREELINAMTMTNRILGFVNAPALMQKALVHLQGQSVDIGLYQKKRDLFCRGLGQAGYQFNIPEGAFYLFPRSPIPDDVAFVRALQEEKILTVPGTGFGAPGYFRIAYCVADETIERSLPGFERVMKKFTT